MYAWKEIQYNKFKYVTPSGCVLHNTANYLFCEREQNNIHINKVYIQGTL